MRHRICYLFLLPFFLTAFSICYAGETKEPPLFLKAAVYQWFIDSGAEDSETTYFIGDKEFSSVMKRLKIPSSMLVKEGPSSIQFNSVGHLIDPVTKKDAIAFSVESYSRKDDILTVKTILVSGKLGITWRDFVFQIKNNRLIFLRTQITLIS